MNNWHIKIEDCTEVQKKRLKRVYGNLPININTYLGLHNGIVIGTFGPDSMGELITPDEAFERLGLDNNDLIEVNGMLLTSETVARNKARAYDEWLDLNSGLLDADECFEHWLKEVGNEA